MITHDRKYISVILTIDPTGFMMPQSIVWSDGRTFPIEKVKDYRPASFYAKGCPWDCYTIVVRGKERYLFYERPSGNQKTVFGRWFIERN